ncbi:MAG: hypothetical protein K8R90_05220 [Candidatus Cloacimonetes bacterium]|nr:hypothetical protein [Candidatus Cloacimonadota bacterium]
MLSAEETVRVSVEIEEISGAMGEYGMLLGAACGGTCGGMIAIILGSRLEEVAKRINDWQARPSPST